MIIGNGLIANALKAIEFSNVIYFCSGVSDSTETRAVRYLRELSLLKSYLCLGLPIYYFSSIFQTPVEQKPYNLHKGYIEKLLLSDQSLKIRVVRLPQVGGGQGNPRQLLNFLTNSILRGEKFSVKKGAKRNFIHVHDLVKIIAYLSESLDSHPEENTVSRSFDVAAPETFDILEIISIIEEEVGKTALYCLDSGYFDNSFTYDSVFYDTMIRKGVVSRYTRAYGEHIVREHIRSIVGGGNAEKNSRV